MSEEKYGSVRTELIHTKYTCMIIFRLSICEDITCITVRKRSLGQGNIWTVRVSHSVHEGWGGGSLHDVTSCLSACPMFLPGGSLSLVPCSFQGVSVWGVSVQGSLSRGRPPDRHPIWWKAGGTLSTWMHSCFGGENDYSWLFTTFRSKNSRVFVQLENCDFLFLTSG